MECLVGQSYLPAAEAPQQIVGGTGAALAHVEPGQAGQRVVHGEQGAGQRDELGADPAGAVVQDLGEPVGEGAASAEPAAVQFVLEAAACAGEGL